MDLIPELTKIIRGDVANDADTLTQASRDASIFQIRPSVVVFPKDEADIRALVSYIAARKGEHPELSLTARAAGTCMSGGPLTDSIVVSFTKYMNQLVSLGDDEATVQMGMYYRDFEKKTLANNLIFPSFPASRELCAMGGIVNNNSGGEESIKYGKTENFVRSLRVVLSDGNHYTIKPLNERELAEKKALPSFEGDIYRRMSTLIMSNDELLKKAKPQVSKNSAGYALWNVWDPRTRTFDLTKLFVGAQGTLGLVTDATIGLIRPRTHARMIVIFLKDLTPLTKIIHSVLPVRPEAFESYDEHTLKLALKYFTSFAKQLGGKNSIRLFFQFLPEMLMVLRSGFPKLVLQAEFTAESEAEVEKETAEALAKLAPLKLNMRVIKTRAGIDKYHVIRRESFNLLRNKIKGKQAAPFIDDFVVPPDSLAQFLPQLDAILKTYDLTYTVAGHIGDGNFHIIPLMNLANEAERAIIPELSKKVYDLVLSFNGSITGEHNDGLIRSYYLEQMFGKEVYALFEETKKIFDPQQIFNPHKKVGSSWGYAKEFIVRPHA